MKSANSLEKRRSATIADLKKSPVREAVLEALTAVGNAVQKCLRAGHLLLEAKEALPYGDFGDWMRANVPEVAETTARNWMRAAQNVQLALPPPPSTDIDAEVMSISEILSTPDDELGEQTRQWKQQYFDFTADKSINACIGGVVVDGDEAHRVDRAINGKTKGGAGGDRKDWPLFCAVKLRDMGKHLGHWSSMTEIQKTEVKETIRAAITGDMAKLRGRETDAFNFTAWPTEVCAVAIEAIKEVTKGRK